MSKNKFIGKWRISEMEQWDQDFIDAEVPGYISFSKDGTGEFHFGYVHGFTDCRYSKREGNNAVEFSWEGNDEADPASGRGYAIIKDGNLSGHLFFHEGEDSEFKAAR
ncbi:MAG: hypothetical protein GY795_17940 [Desulfobacterales bacterium]|nr:hypothetical protein [Desulfobacterales bacterium]